MIFLNSRYAQKYSEVVSVHFDDGTVSRAVLRKPPTRMGDMRWTEYMWREGDRIDLVASRLLGDPSLWWYLMDANPTVRDALAIIPGTVLKVPRGV